MKLISVVRSSLLKSIQITNKAQIILMHWGKNEKTKTIGGLQASKNAPFKT